MKKIVSTLLTVCCLATCVAQTAKCGIDTRALAQEQIAAGASTINFLAKMALGYSNALFTRAGIQVGAVAGDIVSLTVPVDQIALLDNAPEVLLYSIAHTIGSIDMDQARIDTRSENVQHALGTANGNAYDGTGVYIGITDWGFDYTHPNFRDDSGNQRRIARAWDHYRLAGPAPAGFDYGTELIGNAALQAALGDTSNLYNYGTHGTHVAGITTGRGNASGKFRGQAPGADLLLCSFGLDEKHWMDGVDWMRQVAQQDGRRLVVNSSWGMYSFSCLDGKSLLSQAIDNYSKQGIVFCTSAGNNGDVKFHIKRDFDEQPDTLRTCAAYYTYVADAIGQCLIMWGEEGHDFTAQFRLASADGLYAGPAINTAEGDTILYDTIDAGGIRVAYRILAEHENPYDHRPHVQMDVDRNAALQLQLLIHASSGTVHAWNVANKLNHAGNEGAKFHNGGMANFSNGDAAYGIGEPGCAASTLTIAAHHVDTWERDSSAYNPGDIASFSSFGPLIDGSPKPDISAPGYQVNSSISHWTDGNYVSSTTMKANDIIYKWSALSGTSMSCPAVTGIVALMLQANPTLSSDSVRIILQSTARNDKYTGNLHANDSTSVRWGYGKADALDAVNTAVSMLRVNDVEACNIPLRLYPNPATTRATVHSGIGEEQTLELYTIDGRRLHSQRFTTQCTLDLSGLPRGMYIVRVGARSEKLLVR